MKVQGENRQGDDRQGDYRTGLVIEAAARQHVTGPGHPERPERVIAIAEALGESGLAARCLQLPVDETLQSVDLVHSAEYLERLEQTCAIGAAFIDSADTPICEGSFKAAKYAVASALSAVNAVARGEIRNAFSAVRPPGHHAERDFAMGFCLLNSIALAAAHLRRDCSVSRVLIVDWDVHHGNGTQHIFEDDPSVYYCSIHADPRTLYPGTGFREEVGVGRGTGATLNLPMPPGSTGEQWLTELNRELVPAMEKFKPEFVLVSAGFDAHRDDPLGNQDLETEDFGRLTRLVLDIADAHCAGKFVSILEGGYDLDALAECARAHVEELLRSGK